VASRVEPLKQWLATRDRDLLILAGVTCVGFIARWWLAMGFMLGDDISYTDLIRDVMGGHWMQVEAVGQYSYRPMWIYPLAASVKLFGWDYHALVLYPMVTGALIPLLMALWLRRHLPRGSQAPVLCAVILTCYPTLFIDSLMLANEIPMIFWSLLCVNVFGVAFDHLAASPHLGSRPWRLGGWSFLAGLMLAAAYQVKTAAVPALGLWLLADLVLNVRRLGWPKVAPLMLAAAAFAIPTLEVQAYYYSKIGDFLGNFHGELRLYDLNLPREYFKGELDIRGLLDSYPSQLLRLDGYEGYRIFLHGIWIYIGIGLAGLGLLFCWKIPRDERAMAAALVIVTVGLYLFLQYWPTRLKPYYLPNCFTGRPWRYMDVIGVTTSGVIAILFTLPALQQRWYGQAFRIAVLAAGFGVAGYSLMVRGFEFNDRADEFRRVTADRALITPYLDVPHYMDPDGYGSIRAASHFPKKPELIGRGGTRHDKILIDMRKTNGGCAWTGGNRHYGVDADTAWSPDQIQAIGGELRLVHTWYAGDRPWRKYSLQLWAYVPPPPSIHDHFPRH